MSQGIRVLEAMLGYAERNHPEQVPEIKRRIVDWQLNQGPLNIDMSDTVNLTEHRLQIERIIRVGMGVTEAEFQTTAHSPFGVWWICTARIAKDGAKIQTRNTMMTVEQASTVRVGLHMAIDWVASEYQRREDDGPNGDATTPGFFK